MAIHGQTFSKSKHSLFKISKYLKVRHFQSYGYWGKAIVATVSNSVEGLGVTMLKFPLLLTPAQSPGEVCGDEAPVSSENSFLKQRTLTHSVFSL